MAALLTSFGSVIRAARRKKPMSERVADHVLAAITRDESYQPPVGNARELLKLYSTHPWVRTILGKISDGVARQAWYIERPDGSRLDKHPALDFIRAGSKQLRGRAALKVIAAHKGLAGESFMMIGRNGANNTGTPVAWAVVSPDWVKDTPSRLNAFSYRVQPLNGVPFDASEADMVWLRDPNPLDPYGRGTGITGAALMELSTDKSAATFLDKYFKNSARPDLLVSGSEARPLDDKARARLETTWLERFRGAARVGRPLFSANPLEVKELGKALRDNEMSDLRNQLKAAISEIYGVPPEIFGRLENSNRATIDSADYLFAKHTLDPILSWIFDNIEPVIEDNFDLGGGKLKYESPIQEDRAHALAVFSARPSAFTNNEARELAGRKRIERADFDEPPEPVDAEPADDPEDEPPAKKSADVLPFPIKPVQRVISAETVVNVSAAHEDPQVRAEATAIMRQIFNKLIDIYGREVLEQLEAETVFKLNAAVAEFIATEVPTLLGQIDATTRNALRASLVEGAAANEAVADLAKRVDEIFLQAAETRAVMIGQTVATKLTGFAAQTAAEQGGMSRKKWLSSSDQVVRDSHRAMHGQVRMLKEPFAAPSGARAQHPGAFGLAAEDVNCRCAMRPLLDGEKAIADDRFEAWHEQQHVAATRAVRDAFADLFLKQADLVTAALKRATQGLN